ncbi:MAG TPA: hypothetical protein DCS45_21520, partial [Roseovarius nubinhibens]|nr:hypothetical protein [Roseovarius nubinhibens]
ILPPDQRPSPEDLANFRYRPDGGLFDRFRVSEHTRADGSRFWNQQSHALITLDDCDGSDGERQLVIIGCRDITDQVDTESALHRAKDELEHAAFHDDLTGLANRKRLTAY